MIELNFKKMGGLIPAVVQDYKTGEVLMLAFMNQAAWEATLATGKATYYSRTRQELWIKGKTSGNMQIIKEIRIDCDDDTVVLKVDQVGGAACHTGHKSCFYKKVEDGSIRIIGVITSYSIHYTKLYEILIFHPERLNRSMVAFCRLPFGIPSFKGRFIYLYTSSGLNIRNNFV